MLSPVLAVLNGSPASPLDRTVRPLLATMAQVVPVQRFLCVEEEVHGTLLPLMTSLIH